MSYNKKVKRKGENFNVFYLAYFQSVISTCDLNNIIIVESLWYFLGIVFKIQHGGSNIW